MNLTANLKFNRSSYYQKIVVDSNEFYEIVAKLKVVFLFSLKKQKLIIDSKEYILNQNDFILCSEFSKIKAEIAPKFIISGSFHKNYKKNKFIEKGNLYSCPIVLKPWGREYWPVSDQPGFAFKYIVINEGHITSRQYHNIKEETHYIYSGEANIELGCTKKKYLPGSSVFIPAKTLHRIEAITDLHIFETSTPELDDLIRVEDKYGRV